MKIADSDSIRSGEQALIAAIMEKIDTSSLTALATRNLTAEKMEFVNGDMVIMDNRIVYKMDFKVTVGLALIIDREGNIVGDGYDEGGDAEVYESECEDENPVEYEEEPVDGYDGQAPLDRDEDETGHEEFMEDRAGIEEDMDEIIRNSREFWTEKSGYEAETQVVDS